MKQILKSWLPWQLKQKQMLHSIQLARGIMIFIIPENLVFVSITIMKICTKDHFSLNSKKMKTVTMETNLGNKHWLDNRFCLVN